jgi:hypothetical protein
MSNMNTTPTTETTGTEIEVKVAEAQAVQPEATQSVEAPVSQPVAAVKTEPVAEVAAQTAAPAKADPLAEAQASQRVLSAKVLRLIVEPAKDGKDERVVGAHVELADFPRLQPKPFLPGTHRGSKPEDVVQGAAIQVVILPPNNDPKKPGVVVSRKLAQQLAAAEGQKAFVAGLVAGQSVEAKSRRKGKTGSTFVELESGFEALLPATEACDGAGGKLIVLSADAGKMSVILSEKAARAMDLIDQTVPVKVTGTAIRKSDGREVGRECQTAAEGIRAFMPGHTGYLPAEGEEVEVVVTKVEVADGRLKVVVQTPEQIERKAAMESRGSDSSGNSGTQGNQGGRGRQGNDRGGNRGGYRSSGDGQRGPRSDRGRSDDGGRRSYDGGLSRQGGSRKDQRKLSWGEAHGLRQGCTVEGKLVAFEGRAFEVKLASGADAFLDKSEVSDVEMTDEALKALVGQSEKLVVIAVDDERALASVSLKRVFPSSVGLRQPMEGQCSDIKGNGDRIITLGGRLPFKVNAVLPMHFDVAKQVGAIQVGDAVSVQLNSVIDARQLVVKLPQQS